MNGLLVVEHIVVVVVWVVDVFVCVFRFVGWMGLLDYLAAR